MPVGKLVRFGVWEGSAFIGAVVFGDGVSPTKHRMFGVSRFEMTELLRVALRKHEAETSKIVAVAVRLLKRNYPKLRCILSYADTNQNHVGTIYQAMGWIYVGSVKSVRKLVYNGKVVNNRGFTGTNFTTIGGGKNAEVVKAMLREGTIEIIPQKPKHKYAYPLDSNMRASLALLAKPYPKRAPESGAVATSDGKAVQARPARSRVES